MSEVTKLVKELRDMARITKRIELNYIAALLDLAAGTLEELEIEIEDLEYEIAELVSRDD